MSDSKQEVGELTRIVVLGGCGGIGRIATRMVAVGEDFDEIVVADLRGDDAAAFAATVDHRDVRPAVVDATDHSSIRSVIRDADLVLNCVGPFYRFGAPILEAAIGERVGYVDVCDDLDATIAQLELDSAARDAGVCALIGMGNSPGLANVLVRYAADHLLDAVTSVDIMHIHGGEPSEGAAVVKHRIHAMTNDIPVFVEGGLRYVRMLEASGEEFIQDTEFRDVGTFPVYPYPHPETITLPRHLPGLRRCTNSGVVFPLEYFGLTMEMVRTGACTTEPLLVDGVEVVPIEFSVAHILANRERLLTDAGVTGPAGCLKIVVTGPGGGGIHTYVFSLSSTSEGAGEGTGIPAGLAAMLMQRGSISRAGVHPPEALVDPLELMALAGQVIGRLGVTATGADGRVPIHIEHIAPDGTRDELSLGL